MKRALISQWNPLSFHDKLIDFIEKERPTHILYNGAAEFEMPGETFNLISKLEYVLKKYNVHMDYVVGCEGVPKIENSRPNRPLVNTTLHNFPMYWLYMTYQESLISQFNFDALRANYKPQNFTKLFTSLNNIAHEHRGILLDELNKQNLLEKGHVSFRNPENADISHVLESWTQEKLFLDEVDERDDKPENFLPSHLVLSPISIVAESQPDLLFITEKTWFPILLRKPLLVLGAQNFHSYLTYYGFKLHTDFFDYSFDSKTDIRDRAVGISKNLKNIEDLSWEEIYMQTREVCEHNYRVAVGIVGGEKHIPPIIQFYRNLQEESIITDNPLTNLVGF
jgi:hypothetical protein